MPGTAVAPATNNVQSRSNPTAVIPFPIGSRQQSRSSFTVTTQTLSAGALTPVSPIQIPAMGYLRFIRLEVTLTATASGTAPVLAADAPFNLFQTINFRNSGGNDIIVPLTGYQTYLANKYGAQTCQAPLSDKRLGRQFTNTYTTSGGTSHFFLDIPFELDSETGYGSVPALASNRNYQLALTLSSLSTIFSTAPTGATVAIDATAYYWTEPVANSNGVSLATEPDALGTVSLWQVEYPPLTPGDKFIRSNNVGNFIRCIVFVLRNAAGQRIDTNGWPPYVELFVDNDPQFHTKQAEHEQFIAEWYNFQATAKDVAGGLDTGVYVYPFFALSSGYAGDPSGTRAQYLPTLDATLLQLRGAWGSAASTLEILTNSVIPKTPASLYAK